MALIRFSVRLFTIAVFLVALIAGQFTYGQSSDQVTVGVQKFGAYDGFPDTIDVGSLGLHLEIPIYGKSGRGRGTSIDFVLNNYTAYTSHFVVSPDGKAHYLTIGPGPSLGLLGGGSMTTTSSTKACQGIPGSGTYTDTVYQYTDGRGNEIVPGLVESSGS